MKKLIDFLLLIVVLSSITSCKSDFGPMEEGNHRNGRLKENPMFKTIRMSFGGDYVSEAEEPLLRAEDGETFVGINVYYTEQNVENAEKQKYAYGVFNKTSGISINLMTGYTYSFEATVLIEKEDKLQDNATSEKSYGQPFRLSNGDSYFLKDDIGDFFYTYDPETLEKFFLRDIKVGTALVDAGDDLPSQYGDVRYPRVKRYYGELDSFDPSIKQTAEIAMNYKCFGLKLILESIPGDTSVTVEDCTDNGININQGNHPEYYLRFPDGLKLSSGSEDSKQWEGIFSLNNLESNTHDFRLRFTWNKGNGKSETFYHTFTAEAKKKKILKLNVSGEINETKSGNIVLTNLDDALTDETPENVTNSPEN